MALGVSSAESYVNIPCFYVFPKDHYETSHLNITYSVNYFALSIC